MEMTYRQNGDYLIPDIRLSGQEMKPIGKYGQLRKQYLQEHRPILWNRLVLTEQLYPHLAEIDETAHRKLDELMPQLAKQAGVTEELKGRDPLKWAGKSQKFGFSYPLSLTVRPARGTPRPPQRK